MKISEAQALTKEIAGEFDEKYKKRKSTASLYFVDLIETLGELAGTVKIKEFWHTTPEFYQKKPKRKLENELVDFLYDILMIANVYNINLEEAFINRMQEFKKKFLAS